MNPRVTPQGQAMGANTARIAELGEAVLQRAGVAMMGLPMLRDEMCRSCACRLDTVPNGCLITQLDLLKAAHEGKPFLCHAPKDGRVCAGWVRMRARMVADPLPAAAAALVAKWEYSSADESNQAGSSPQDAPA